MILTGIVCLYAKWKKVKLSSLCCGARGAARSREEKRVRDILDLDPPPLYAGVNRSYGLDKKQHVSLYEMPDNSFYDSLSKGAKGSQTLSTIAVQQRRVAQEAQIAKPAPVAYTRNPPGINTGLASSNPYYTMERTTLQTQHLGASPTSSDMYTPMSEGDPNNQTMLSKDARDPAQRHVNHLSTLSSLSSGFGDGLRMSMAASTANSSEKRGIRGQHTPKFSWNQSSKGGSRDETYTNSSLDATPHFRTINSWVSQQSGHLHPQQQAPRQPQQHSHPNSPEVPGPSAAHFPLRKPALGDPIFRPQPGEPMQVSRGSGIIYQQGGG